MTKEDFVVGNLVKGLSLLWEQQKGDNSLASSPEEDDMSSIAASIGHSSPNTSLGKSSSSKGQGRKR
jgi:hypothetical protein